MQRFVKLMIVISLCEVWAKMQSYKGYKLLRLSTKCVDWLENVNDQFLEANSSDVTQRPIIDIWSEPSKYRQYADVLVAPEFLDKFHHLLVLHDIKTFEIVKEDIQRDIDRQRSEIQNLGYDRLKRNLYAQDNLQNFDLIAYHRYDKIVSYVKYLARLHKSFASTFNITKTFEGRDIVGLKIGEEKRFRPAVFIDAGLHGREWIAPAVALYVANKLITRYGKTEAVTNVVDKFNWYIVPVANPDGYEYSMTKDRLWRKTRSRNNSVNKWCIGADANRNWGYRWGEAGASRSPCSNIYPGSEPFSEAEIAGMRDFTTQKIPDLKIYISLHSYGQMFLGPWGYTNDRPRNYYDQRAAAQRAVDAIRKKTGANYNHGTISELMYTASGTSIDYMQYKGVPYVYGVELRPEDGVNGFGFTIPARYIKPTGEEILSAFLEIAQHTIDKML